MSQPDLPADLSLTIVRRWECSNCGARGGKQQATCNCQGYQISNARHIQFTLSK